MLFPTKVSGIPCQCRITHFLPSRPMRVYGPGMGDADPPEGGELSFELVDRKGYPAPWLERKLDEPTIRRIEDECLIMLGGEFDDF